MVEFGELTNIEKEKFFEEINKNMNKSITNKELQLWPDDDESVTKNYFKKGDI